MIRIALAASILAAVALAGPANPTNENEAETRPAAAQADPGGVISQPQAIVLGQPFKLKYGETAQLSDDPLRITFNSVVEDSRCPLKVQCVWAGRVVVGLTAALPDGPTQEFELQLGANQGVLTYNVALSAVEPPRTEGATPSDESYVLTLTVTAAQ